MGTTEEENAYKQQQEQATTQAPFERAQREQEQNDRLAAEAEAARKAAEDALVNGTGSGKSKMIAAEPAAANWPDNEVGQKPQSGLGKVAGALRVGKEGDVAFARDLLNSGQAPLDRVNAAAKGADGAKEGVAGAPAAKPALGLG